MGIRWRKRIKTQMTTNCNRLGDTRSQVCWCRWVSSLGDSEQIEERDPALLVGLERRGAVNWWAWWAGWRRMPLTIKETKRRVYSGRQGARCLRFQKTKGGEQRNIEIAKSIARGGSALPLCGIALSLPKRKIHLQTLMFFPLVNVPLHKTHIGSSLIHIY